MKRKILNPADLFTYDEKTLHLAAGEALFKEGEHGDKMYVLQSGKAEIYVKGKLVEEAWVGAILGEMALIDDMPRAATVVALTDCQFAVLDENEFHSLIKEAPFFATHLMRLLVRRLRNADQD